MVVASALTDVAILAGVLGAVIIAYKLVTGRDFKSLLLKAGPVELDLKAIERIEQKVDAVNRRVNNVPADAPTIPEQLTEMSGRLAVIEQRLGDYMPGHEIASRLDVLTAIARRQHPSEFPPEEEP